MLIRSSTRFVCSPMHIRPLPSFLPARTSTWPETSNSRFSSGSPTTTAYRSCVLRTSSFIHATNLRRLTSRMWSIPLTGTGPDRIVPWTWNLGPLRLTPEDVIEYHAEVYDNDMVSGPKMAMSETYTLRLPSIDEVFADVDKGHEESRETLQDALKQAEEAKKQLDELCTRPEEAAGAACRGRTRRRRKMLRSGMKRSRRSWSRCSRPWTG